MLESKDEIWESVARSSGILRMYKKLPGGLLTTRMRAYMIQAPTGSRSKHVGASTRYSNLIIYAKAWARQRGVDTDTRANTQFNSPINVNFPSSQPNFSAESLFELEVV